MKTLRSSSLKIFPGGGKDVPALDRAQVCFFGNQQQLNAGSISSRHKKKMMMMIRPVLSSSLPTSFSSESQAEFDTAETQTQDESKTVHVKLQLQRECSFGEHFLIVGDDPMFGMWDPLDAIPLIWTEEHIWAAELEIPIGRTIQFKFILNEVTGNILWQPAPDRILRTWETNNTITILEDWENAELQNITEEGPDQTKNEVFSLPNKELGIDDINKTLEEIPLMSMVAENITSTKEKSGTTIEEGIIGNNDEKEILVKHEGGPVLVPGLTPLTDEAKTWNASETEFSEQQQEPGLSLHQEVTKMMFKEEEEEDLKGNIEVQQNLELLKVKEQLRSDLQWGRETLRKFISYLGLF